MYLCAVLGEVSNLDCERRHFSLYHLLVSLESYWSILNLGIFTKRTAVVLHLNLPLGVTNEERLPPSIKQISGAVAGDSRSYK